MTHNTQKTKIFMFALGLVMCLALMPGIAMASPTFAAYAAGETEIDTLSVAFNKVIVGESLAAAFEFEDETAKTLKVPAGANYTATLVFVTKNGQATTVWEKDKASFPWSRVENQLVEKKVAYCIRVLFEPKENYKLSKDADVLKSHMKVTGAELGKGNDIELWDSAGQNSVTTAIEMDFLISRGMTYVGYSRYIAPRINEKVSGKIATEYTDTGIWLSGAPGPYTYEAKIAPIGMEIQTSNAFDKSYCYYQIIAKNAMDGGTMYITATAADGQTCDIPVTIAAVSGGHEHTWVEKIEKIDFEHHGYTKCTDPACPGVAPAFDKGSQYASHEFVGGCTEKCTTCGDLGNPNAKHNLKLIAVKPATCSTTGMNAHYTCEGCGKYFDESKNETTEAALTIPTTDDHTFGTLIDETPATCKDTGVKEHRDCRLCKKHCDPITRKEIADLTIPTTNNHTYGELIPEVPATTTEFGVKEHKDCTVCERHFDKDGNEITELRIAKIGTHNVIVNGESKFYAHGESVTVTANEPAEGKVFVGWKDASGAIVSTDKSYTFKVTGETTLTAVYEDAPVAKDGLSGGAIAGIVIGSAAVAGIGGFAIFWFAVRKKTFADLIAAIKGTFKNR